MRVAPALLVALTALAACSSNSSSSGSPAGGSLGGNDGGPTCGAFGAALGIGNSGNPCSSCMVTTCRTEYVAAYGASGATPGGACKAYWDCVCACSASDSNCQVDCSMNKLDEGCQNAQIAFSDCVDTKCSACNAE
jgi:hypothetical protein